MKKKKESKRKKEKKKRTLYICIYIKEGNNEKKVRVRDLYTVDDQIINMKKISIFFTNVNPITQLNTAYVIIR